MIRCICRVYAICSNEALGEMSEELLKANMVDCMSFVISHRSGYFDAGQLQAESLKMRDEVCARLANDKGILIDPLNIYSVVKTGQ